MSETERPLRADAARNRARILEVAYQTFAAEGLAVPIDEIARRAGVGAGTVYRHFPAKEDLYRAVIAERIRGIVDHGRELVAAADPSTALFDFLRSMVQWGTADRGVVDALAGEGIEIDAADFLGMFGQLLVAAQRVGAVRTDVTVAEVKALLVGCQAIQAYNPSVSDHVIEVALDGLRPHF
ncbi:TetR/AcrR family transcriptional regulator [Mycobacterium sp. C31M]